MSYCKSNGKDKVVFVTKDDAEKPPVVAELLDEEEYGVILPDGSINWDCPCLGGLPTGPCGEEFKSSFSCFHYSDEDPKGSDCIEQFVAMQECFKSHPELYSKYDKDIDDEDDELTDNTTTTTTNTTSDDTTDTDRTNDDNNDNKE